MAIGLWWKKDVKINEVCQFYSGGLLHGVSVNSSSLSYFTQVFISSLDKHYSEGKEHSVTIFCNDVLTASETVLTLVPSTSNAVASMVPTASGTTNSWQIPSHWSTEEAKADQNRP